MEETLLAALGTLHSRRLAYRRALENLGSASGDLAWKLEAALQEAERQRELLVLAADRFLELDLAFRSEPQAPSSH